MRNIVLALLACCALRGQDSAVFDFRSNFWVNLHHFLYEQAKSKEPVASDSAEWRAAVEYYRDHIAKQDLLDDDLARINFKLSELDESATAKATAIIPVLESAAPVYRKQWWPQHNRANLAWIEATKPLVAKYIPAFTKQIAVWYETPWPKQPIRVDISEYASWAGAYTNINPAPHITMTSGSEDYQGLAAVEMLCHESSHLIVDKILVAMDHALAAQKKLFKRRAFWHAVLFYTAGEIVTRNVEGYTQVGIKRGILERGWPGSLPVLEKDWKPYLDGKIDLATAIRRLVDDYGVPRPSPPNPK